LLRAGFLTSAARAKASILKVQEVSHRISVDMLAGYLRDAGRYRDQTRKDPLQAAETCGGPLHIIAS
jgi:hypothetical protein